MQSGDVSELTKATGASFAVVTLGCAKNEVDSEAIGQLLEESGHSRTDPTEADVVIVNTCGFIQEAKQESIDVLLALAKVKRPGQRLVAAGCLTERYGDEIAREIHEVDAMWGARNWASAPRVVRQVLAPSWQARQPGSSLELMEMAPAGALDLVMPPRMATGPSAFVKISDGCNQRCAFCAIPSMKGRLRSKSPEAILREVAELRDAGVKEIVLIAQDSTNYGHDLGLGRDGLALLLERLTDEVPDIPWIRVMYVYPARLTERLLRLIAERPQICRYIDIPLQHTHPAVLRRMRRPHRPAEELVDWIRSRVPGIALRTTFIVGFPGESDEEFEYLRSSVERLEFDRVGAFLYSDEEGTPAYTLPRRVPLRVKKQRQQALMSTAQSVSRRRLSCLVGAEMNVLVEGKSSLSGSPAFVGRSYRDAPEVDGVVFIRQPVSIGSFTRVRIVRALDYDLVGEPLPER